MSATQQKVNIIRRVWMIKRHGQDPAFPGTHTKQEAAECIMERIEAELRRLDEQRRR